MTHLRLATWLLMPVALAALLLLAACGGSGNSGSSTPTPASSANLDQHVVQQLRDLAAKWAAANAKITYESSSTSGSLSTQTTAILYEDLPNSRIDVVNADTAITVISRADSGYSCSMQGSQSSCTALSTTEAETAADVIPFLGELSRTDSTSKIIAGATSMDVATPQTVAGKSTTCIHASGNLGQITGEATWCFSGDGLILSQAFKGNATTFTMTATKVEQTQASDFDPPFPVVTAPPSASPTSSQ